MIREGRGYVLELKWLSRGICNAGREDRPRPGSAT